ncbi:hypothetical protein Ancab_034295 [Ancistrocladus abbreviatus]
MDEAVMIKCENVIVTGRREVTTYKPTGMLAQKAKATGFSSVSEFLQLQGPVDESQLKIGNCQDPIAVSPCKQEKKHVLDGNPTTNIHPQLFDICFSDTKSKKAKMESLIKVGDAEKQDDILKESGIPGEVVEEKVDTHSDNIALQFDIRFP